MDKFILLTDKDTEEKILLNTRFIVRADRDEDDEYTTVVMHDHDDPEVKETPRKIHTLIGGSPTKSETVETDLSGDKNLSLNAATPALNHTVVASEPNWENHK